MKKADGSFLIFIVILLCVASVLSVSAQSKKGPRSLMARVDSNKPTVYMTFNGVAQKQIGQRSDEQTLRLELHNNTRWTIFCYLTPGAASTGDAHITYKVENVQAGRTIYRDTGDVV